MPHVYVQDEYLQSWRIEDDDALYKEALAAVKKAKEEPVIWPIAKITAARGWGWWTVFQKLDDFEEDLIKLVPHPGKNRLLAIDQEYTPTELQDLLQKFGSYLSSLHHLEGMLEAQCHAVKEGFKTGVAIAVAQSESKAGTLTAKEAEVVAGNSTFRDTRKLQISSEAQLILLKGWRESYTIAWNTVSRIITLRMGEAGLSTGRHA